MSALPIARTFDDLSNADLDQVYQQGREEVLRDHAFRILLARADTVAKLEQLAFAGEQGLAGWTIKELIEISNRFRLLSSPENEIRLYRQCRAEAFRHAPRVRGFYVLALNKLGCPAAAILESSRLIAEGDQNALLWGTLGEAYTARMLYAEQLTRALTATNGDPTASDPSLSARLAGYFPTITLADLTIARVRALREENLGAATRMFQYGFRESGSSFTGLGWLQRTLDRLADRVVERQRLQCKSPIDCLDDDEVLRLRLANDEIRTLEKALADQMRLIKIALELQGGAESLDYWTKAGILLCLVIQGVDLAELRAALAQLFKVVDAAFKLTITITELRRIHDQYAAMHLAGYFSADDTARPAQIQGVAFAITECEAGRARFQTTGRATYVEAPSRAAEGQQKKALSAFLEKTINFRTLTGNLVPLCITGAIGRVGARVPDLLINRQVQADLADLVETKVIQALPPADREDPRAVIARIQQVVGAGLKLGDLQDLQSAAHFAFDTRSDGLIALAGADHDMRRHTRTATDLTATLLMQNGDCRETMYLNGALFACWQQMQVKKRIAKAMLCLDLDFNEGFERIVEEEIPALMGYQLRGGQAAVYVDSIAMYDKYQSARLSATDPTALLRVYGLEEVRAHQPLTRYELERAKIEVTYRDGSTRWIEPKDAQTERWRPLDHTPAPGGGVPIIPNLEQAQSIRLLSLVEDHAMTFLYQQGDDTQPATVEFCDGFYSQKLFDSPYAFDGGPVNLNEIISGPTLLRAGSRTVLHPDGSRQPHAVYLQFLHFSQTDYEAALVEGDVPGTIQLMGRTFSGDLQRERRRLEEGASPIPALLEKIQHWQLQRQQTIKPDRKQTEQQLARLMLDLARDQPELVQLKEASVEQALITEAVEHHSVYLVLSGELYVYRYGERLHDASGNPVRVAAGSILGEIAALHGGIASATVAGNAVVLSLTQTVFRQQVDNNPAFRQSVEALAGYRVL